MVTAMTVDARARLLWHGPSTDPSAKVYRPCPLSDRCRSVALRGGLGLRVQDALSTMRVMDGFSGC